ncbi:hypothetical protein PRUPE_3G085800 [Prunus persica]|uniref:Uncharacterized protein n=1 Tax=Prunus persica TaxID=3760 RepID=A0A251PXL3_PRUPE|nr:hypothetical protein PRUPE_3G085800 [Prunus persica]
MDSKVDGASVELSAPPAWKTKVTRETPMNYSVVGCKVLGQSPINRISMNYKFSSVWHPRDSQTQIFLKICNPGDSIFVAGFNLIIYS